jgi:anti-sigma B factor antagonist
MSGLTLRENRDAGTTVMTVGNEIDAFTAPGFRVALVGAIEKGCDHLVVDLTNVTFLDSSGINALVGTAKVAARNGTSLRVVVSRPSVVKPLLITGVNRIVALYDTLPEALSEMPVPRRAS